MDIFIRRVDHILVLALLASTFGCTSSIRQHGDEAFRSAQTAKIVIREMISDKRGPLVEEKDIAKWLRVAGLETVGPNVSDYDMLVTVSARGGAIVGTYNKYGNRWHDGVPLYTGARVEGEIDIVARGRTKRAKFEGLIFPQNKVFRDEYTKPSDAPLREALGDAFHKSMAGIMIQCYGLDFLTNALTRGSAEIRRGVALKLYQMDGSWRVEPLITALKDSDAGTRIAAVRALREIKDPRTTQPLVEALEDTSPRVRETAAWRLGEVKDPRAVKPLVTALLKEWPKRKLEPHLRHSNNPFVTRGTGWRMMWALKEINDPCAVEPLIAALEKDSPNPQDVASFLRRMDRDPKSTDARTIYAVLYHAALEEGSWSQDVVSFLGRMGKDPNSADALPVHLRAKVAELYLANVREVAAYILGRMKDPRATEPLIEALSDPSSEVRAAAAHALREIDDPRAAEGLIVRLKDESVYVRQAATWALKDITGQRFGEDHIAWKAWWEKNKGAFLRDE